MKDRIIQLMEHENLSASKFAEIIGVQRSSISHIQSGRNKPSLDIVQKIKTSFPHLNLEWLISGEGEMYHDFEATEKYQNQDGVLPIFSNYSEKSGKENIAIQKGATLSELMKANAVSQKQIEKIVVFYTDKTFTECKPT